MALGLDDLETFKTHRNKVSESLSSLIVGREKEIYELLDLLNKEDYIVISGASGVGKSRLAIALIEKYILMNKDVRVLCAKNFGDYIQDIDREIKNNKEKYLIFIDDANEYNKINELITFLEYKNNDNIKVIFTVRSYLKDCFKNNLSIYFYEIKSLSNDKIKEALTKNTNIKNDTFIREIIKVSNGNIRIAFICADVLLKNNESFNSFLNVKDIINKFYKDELDKTNKSKDLIVVAGIIALFNNIYLEEIYYISPILNFLKIDKRQFLDNVNTLIDLEIADEYNEIIKISDQCFRDYLIEYNLIDKKYIKFKDLILSGYKYYKNIIIHSINNLINVYKDENFISNLNKELVEICSYLTNIDIKHDLEGAFTPLILDYSLNEFKNGIENFNDDKDINWLLNVFSALGKSKYYKVSLEGIFKLLNKTKKQKEEVIKTIENVYKIDKESIENDFEYTNNFVIFLRNNEIINKRFYDLTSSYLSLSFKDLFFEENEFKYYSFKINDNFNSIINLRKNVWIYIFNFYKEDVINNIVKLSMYELNDEVLQIVQNDLEIINKNINKLEDNEILKILLFLKFENIIKSNDYMELIPYSDENKNIIQLILNDNKEKSINFIKKTKEKEIFNLLEFIKKIYGKIGNYYNESIKNFSILLIENLNKYDLEILNFAIFINISPKLVIEKYASKISLGKIYKLILEINDNCRQDEYLYCFYSYLNELDEDQIFNFDKWIDSKKDKKTNVSFYRTALSLKNISTKSHITYIELIKKFYNKKYYNPFIAKMYLEFLIFNENEFKELIDLNVNIGIKIYEFLIKNNANDCDNKILKIIINSKNNYIKTVAKMFCEKNTYFDCENFNELIFKSEYKTFLKTILKEVNIKCVSYKVLKFIYENSIREEFQDYFIDYIKKYYKDIDKMKSLFLLLFYCDFSVRNKFIIKYCEFEKNLEVIKNILINNNFYFNSNFLKSRTNEIKSLEELKGHLNNWDHVEIIDFINNLIEFYKDDIKYYKIYEHVDYIDEKYKNELKELDSKTSISLKEGLELYCNNNGFRNIVSSDLVSYDNNKFITKENKELKFIDIIKNRNVIEIQVIPIKEGEDVKYNNHIESLEYIKNIFKNNRILTLDECLIELFKEKKWNSAIFGQETSLSKDIYSKIINNKKNKMDKITLIKILLGLRIAKEIRNYLLELNQTILSRYNREDTILMYLLEVKADINVAEQLLDEINMDLF